MPWRLLVVLGGLNQLGIALGSLAIPKVLGWREEANKLNGLTRSVFWTYAGYIWSAHVAFALLSLLAPDLLLDGTPLARCVAGFMAVWWGARIVLQFTFFDRSAAPQGKLYTLGEVALVGAFVANTALYTAVAARGAF